MTFPPSCRLSAARAAFTLIELLVSMVVLTLLVVLIVQMVDSATAVTVGNSKHLNADDQARLVFDRMAYDIAKMVKNPNADYLFAKIDGAGQAGSNPAGQNDEMFFYSEAPAYYDGLTSSSTQYTLQVRGTAALIGYRINAAFQLERLGKVLTWDGTPNPAASPPAPGGMVFLSPTATSGRGPDPLSTLTGNWPTTIGTASDNPVPYSGGSDPDYQVLASQVCRLEFCFELTDGSFSALPIALVKTATGNAYKNNLSASGPPGPTDDYTTEGYVAGSRWYDSVGARSYVCANSATPGAAVWNYLGLQDVRAVVVALAILDAASSKIVASTQVTVGGQQMMVPDLSDLVGVFADAKISDAVDASNHTSGSTLRTIPNLAPAPGSPARLMAEAWGNTMNPPNVASFVTNSGLPPAAAAQVRIYQRSLVLNNQNQ